MFLGDLLGASAALTGRKGEGDTTLSEKAETMKARDDTVVAVLNLDEGYPEGSRRLLKRDEVGWSLSVGTVADLRREGPGVAPRWEKIDPEYMDYFKDHYVVEVFLACLERSKSSEEALEFSKDFVNAIAPKILSDISWKWTREYIGEAAALVAGGGDHSYATSGEARAFIIMSAMREVVFSKRSIDSELAISATQAALGVGEGGLRRTVPRVEAEFFFYRERALQGSDVALEKLAQMEGLLDLGRKGPPPFTLGWGDRDVLKEAMEIRLRKVATEVVSLVAAGDFGRAKQLHPILLEVASDLYRLGRSTKDRKELESIVEKVRTGKGSNSELRELADADLHPKLHAVRSLGELPKEVQGLVRSQEASVEVLALAEILEVIAEKKKDRSRPRIRWSVIQNRTEAELMRSLNTMLKGLRPIKGLGNSRLVSLLKKTATVEYRVPKVKWGRGISF